MRHLIAAAIYAGAWVAVLFTEIGDTDSFGVAVAAAGSLLAGIVSASWWAIGLCALLPLLVAADPCDPAVERCETDWVFLAAVYWAPISAVAVAVGVALARLLRSRPRRRGRGSAAGGESVS